MIGIPYVKYFRFNNSSRVSLPSQTSQVHFCVHGQTEQSVQQKIQMHVRLSWNINLSVLAKALFSLPDCNFEPRERTWNLQQTPFLRRRGGNQGFKQTTCPVRLERAGSAFPEFCWKQAGSVPQPASPGHSQPALLGSRSSAGYETVS